ncbi:hypothetical protein [Pseudomonas sp. LB3P38]|uniref:hypothetical protein n=1 Tax=Pseudomonas lyxosi TaxID=3398358 RepID=UPI0039F00ECA
MNPESITTSQLLGSFTARHWFYTITAIVSALTLVATLGAFYGKYESSVQLAELKGQLDKVDIQLRMTESERDDAVKRGKEWSSAYKELEVNYKAQSEKISDLSLKVGRSNNDDFIHQQIVATQEQIDAIRYVITSDMSSGYRAIKLNEVEALQERLKGYQVQLENCN